jgi:hypothetical protein
MNPERDIVIPKGEIRVLGRTLRCRNITVFGKLWLNGFRLFCSGTLALSAGGEVLTGSGNARVTGKKRNR